MLARLNDPETKEVIEAASELGAYVPWLFCE
jgi:hypothetical protein